MPYPLYIITYERGSHWQTGRPKAHHWAFLIEITPSKAIKHQLRGMPGAYHYPGPEEADANGEEPAKCFNAAAAADFNTDGASATLVVAKLEIGSVGADNSDALEKFESVCKAVYIETEEDKGGEGKWNCQDWCLGALDKLQSMPMTCDVWYKGAEVKQWLREKNSE
ncbi:hypothetical protein ABW20_dc0102446 [Dactylellina cionopaga]|nr:hypothetical protein ABW20_dc0102446 [Dactylellina cionopaga]